MTGFDVGVSVVVPTFLGANRLSSTLQSLVDQSVARDLMQVVVVSSGPDDGALDFLGRFRSECPGIDLLVTPVTQAGLGGAMNVGLRAASREYVTFVDGGDTVSPSYVEGLLGLAGPDVVGQGFVADLTDGDERNNPDFATCINQTMVRFAGTVQTPNDAHTWMGSSAAKIVRTDLARGVRVREDLLVGAEVVFWTELVDRLSLRVKVAQPVQHIVYYRTVRAESGSYTVDPSPRIHAHLDVIEILMPIAQDHARWASRAAWENIGAQARHISSYLQANPDFHEEALAQIAERDLPEFPFELMNRNRARDLVVAYAFPPTNDTSAIVAAKRVRDTGVCVDVVSHRMGRIRDLDPGIDALTREYVGNQVVVEGKVSLLGWEVMGQFVSEGWDAIANWEAARGQSYRSVYSRAMWPASHLLAALYALRRPETTWRAEFSDPLLIDSNGNVRTSAIGDDSLAAELMAGLAATSFDLPDGHNVPEFIEHLVYAIADEIVFTNHHQMEFMLEHVEDPALVERVRARAVIRHHPTLEQHFYELGAVDYPLDKTRVNIGYFGMFYASRSLTEVVDAISLLSRQERRRLTLHVFTRDPGALAKKLGRGLANVIRPTGYLPYLDFLAVTRQFDILLVNDAKVTDSHGINPYLPSKVSDYLGSGTDIWSLVEEGSVLSSIDTRYTSTLRDVHGALAVLRRAIADHSG